MNVDIVDGKVHQSFSGITLAKITARCTWQEEIHQMSEQVVICKIDECQAENKDWQDKDGTYWFTCTKCGYDNELVYAGWK